MATETTGQVVKVFYCYAREDKVLRDELDAHLTPLRRSGRIKTWSDRQIEPGTNWQEAIDENLETADLILILVSAQFMRSDYCWGKEMMRALERHKAGKAHIIPVILRPVMWKETPLGELQALPQDGKPVIQWPHLDIALENVAQGVSGVVTTLLAKLEQEAIHQQKIGDLMQKINEEKNNKDRLETYQRDLDYTLQSKRQSEAQLLEQLATLRTEMDQIKALAETTSMNIASSESHLAVFKAEYNTIAEHPYLLFGIAGLSAASLLRRRRLPAPKLLAPPFTPRDE